MVAADGEVEMAAHETAASRVLAAGRGSTDPVVGSLAQALGQIIADAETRADRRAAALVDAERRAADAERDRDLARAEAARVRTPAFPPPVPPVRLLAPPASAVPRPRSVADAWGRLAAALVGVIAGTAAIYALLRRPALPVTVPALPPAPPMPVWTPPASEAPWASAIPVARPRPAIIDVRAAEPRSDPLQSDRAAIEAASDEQTARDWARASAYGRPRNGAWELYLARVRGA